MSLIATATVKTKFPQWESILKTVADQIDMTPTAYLEDCIADAETLFTRYVKDVSAEADMTDDYNLILMAVIRYEAFQRRHADAKFEHPPFVVQEGLKAIDLLKRGLVGAAADLVQFTQHERMFGPIDPDADAITIARS